MHQATLQEYNLGQGKANEPNQAFPQLVVNHAIASVEEKFWAVPTLAFKDPQEFFAVYYQLGEDTLEPILIFYPEYYRTITARLYNFDGEAVTPQSSTVVFYDSISYEGETYKIITDSKSFPTYEEAAAYVSSHQSDNCQLVGDNPFVSPVPLEEMEHYKLIYSSKLCIMELRGRMVPEIKIFEYVK